MISALMDAGNTSRVPAYTGGLFGCGALSHEIVELSTGYSNAYLQIHEYLVHLIV
jgi:hypothetical protein